MGVKTPMSVEQYLTTSFPDLDKEYRDGELEERSLPDTIHARTQILLGVFFMALSRTLGLWPYTEARVKIRDGVYLIPDISVFYPDRPGRIPDIPAFIVVEILSEDDRLSRVQTKLQEYRDWGVPHVWLVDPYAKIMYTCNVGLVPVATLRVPELGIEIQPADIFD